MSFRKLLSKKGHLIFDGAMGTMLQKRGLPAGESPELFCYNNPEVLLKIHEEYCQAGSDVITTNTFGGTSYKLPSNCDVFLFNQKMAKIAKEATKISGSKTLVAGSIGPTGKFLRPVGDLTFNDLVLAFREQIKGLIAGGVDLIIAETQYDIAEARAIVYAARQESSLPVIVSMTYENGVTLTGSTIPICVATLANMGVDMIGINCSAGPLEMKDSIELLLASSPVPVLVQPNAGLPELKGDTTVFPLEAEEFSNLVSEFAKLGAKGVGGCCGTTPKHIASLKSKVSILDTLITAPKFNGIAITSRSSLIRIGEGYPFCVIGERINPTGKKQLTAELQAGDYTTAFTYADEQIAAGSLILDVNVGAPLVDEVELLPDLVERLVSTYPVPLTIDSSNANAVAAAVFSYPASPLINSISGEHGRMELLGPLCRDLGIPFILLPLKGSNLPETSSERIKIVEKLLEDMEKLNIPRNLAIVDILALSVSSMPTAIKESIEFISYCKNTLKLPTTCGLSNISFGLPARDLLNSTFAALGVGAGLNSCIANPLNPRLSETLDSLSVLENSDIGAESFISSYSSWKHGSTTLKVKSTEKVDVSTIESAVIMGKKDLVIKLLQEELDKGSDPFELVGKRLIPAITEVGAMYERKEYFLPQLIRSAEAMQKGFALLKPLLEKDSKSVERPNIIMATVEGDIHDIGKNIVCLLLGNHGFNVIDLGKDVPASKIVAAAEEHNAKIIGLSALMTTTMVRMEDTVKLLKEKNLDKHVIVGGAVLTDAFAKAIDAIYAKDAVETVRLANKLLSSNC